MRDIFLDASVDLALAQVEAADGEFFVMEVKPGNSIAFYDGWSERLAGTVTAKPVVSPLTNLDKVVPSYADEAVLAFNTAGAIHTLDATASKAQGVVSGAFQGRHRYEIAGQVNTVDLLGETTPIAIIAGANVTVNGVEVEKSNTGNSWNSSFYSTLAFDPNVEDFAVSWLIEETTGTIREMAGLDDSPSQNNSYSSIEYAVYQVNGYFYSRVYEGGTAILIPGYSTFYFQMGDRVGVKCIDGFVTYFVIRAGVETKIYTSTKRATVPLYFKGAFNRGDGSSGHSNIGSVKWHTAKKTVGKTVHVEGGAADLVSDADTEKLAQIGMDVQSGATYGVLTFARNASSKFDDAGTPFDLAVSHAYLASFAETSLTATF